jgi:hypothetical protein
MAIWLATATATRSQSSMATVRRAQWVTESLADFDVERMGAMSGEVMVSRVNADLLQPAGVTPARPPADASTDGRSRRPL